MTICVVYFLIYFFVFYISHYCLDLKFMFANFGIHGLYYIHINNNEQLLVVSYQKHAFLKSKLIQMSVERFNATTDHYFIYINFFISFTAYLMPKNLHKYIILEKDITSQRLCKHSLKDNKLI